MFSTKRAIGLGSLAASAAVTLALSMFARANTSTLATLVAFRASGIVPISATLATMAVAKTLSATQSTVASVMVGSTVLPPDSYTLRATAAGSLAVVFATALPPGRPVVVKGMTSDATATSSDTAEYRTTLSFGRWVTMH